NHDAIFLLAHASTGGALIASRSSHTERWAGSRTLCTTLARSSRTESRSTVSFRVAANAVTVWSASQRARLNLPSTICWTRRRGGAEQGGRGQGGPAIVTW